MCRVRGGYHHWHSELYPQNASCETLHRVLLFQFYLDDVEQGGETEFLYQERKVEARKGRLIIAPAGFTHPQGTRAGQRRQVCGELLDPVPARRGAVREGGFLVQ